MVGRGTDGTDNLSELVRPNDARPLFFFVLKQRRYSIIIPRMRTVRGYRCGMFLMELNDLHFFPVSRLSRISQQSSSEKVFSGRSTMAKQRDKQDDVGHGI